MACNFRKIMNTERRLVPIVSLDIEGYTRLIQRDEQAALNLVRHVFTSLVGGSIGKWGGSIFKTMGDGVLAEFASIVSAIEWMAGLQRQLDANPLIAPDGAPLRMRAGIVLADVMVAGEDRFGEGVNMAGAAAGCGPPAGWAGSTWVSVLGSRAST